MKKYLPFTNSGAARDRFPTASLPRLVDSWLYDGEAASHSDKTAANRRVRLAGLVWFLKDREYEECGVEELREFFVYLRRGHQDARGPFGNPRLQTSPQKTLQGFGQDVPLTLAELRENAAIELEWERRRQMIEEQLRRVQNLLASAWSAMQTGKLPPGPVQIHPGVRLADPSGWLKLSYFRRERLIRTYGDGWTESLDGRALVENLERFAFWWEAVCKGE